MGFGGKHEGVEELKEIKGRKYIRMPELKKVRKNPEWSLNYDKVSGCDYYYNYKTGESSWEMPAGYRDEKTSPPENNRIQIEGLYHTLLQNTGELSPPGLVVGVFSDTKETDPDLVPKFEKRFTESLMEVHATVKRPN